MQKCPVFSPMPLGRSHEFDGAVAMEVVVPSDKGRDPFPGFFQGVEGPFHRIFRMVLQSFEEGLRIGIVITDRRTSERVHILAHGGQRFSFMVDSDSH